MSTTLPGLEDLPLLFRTLRGKRTQEEAAKLAGAPRSTWGSYEQGNQSPTLSRFVDILRRFGYRAELTRISAKDHADALLEAAKEGADLSAEAERALEDPTAAYLLMRIESDRQAARDAIDELDDRVREAVEESERRSLKTIRKLEERLATLEKQAATRG